jgi:hypothetical protein
MQTSESNTSESNTSEFAKAVLTPGQQISLPSIASLAHFEDALAPLIKPDYNPVLWAARKKIEDEVRPPKFYGNYANLKLEVLDCPYERAGQASNHVTHLDNPNLDKSQFFAFSLSADCQSTGRGKIGELATTLFYWPVEDTTVHVPSNKNGKAVSYQSKCAAYSYIYNTGARKGKTINRKVSKPVLNTNWNQEAHNAGVAIALEVLINNLKNPISTPMQY